MATIDSSMLSVTYGAILASSSIIKQKFWDCMEQLEDNPSGFPELDDVPERIRTAYANLTWRKIYLESNKHSFRLGSAQLEVFRGQGTHADRPGTLFCANADIRLTGILLITGWKTTR